MNKGNCDTSIDHMTSGRGKSDDDSPVQLAADVVKDFYQMHHVAIGASCKWPLKHKLCNMSCE